MTATPPSAPLLGLREGCDPRAVRIAGTTMKLRIYVTLKPGVLDPQGKAIEHALSGLGFSGVEGARVGKLIELEVAESIDDAQIDAMCRQLLANTVIENYRVERA